MSTTNGQNGGVRFGAYEVNLETGELRRGGLRIKLQPQPFKILALLLENPGQVVTRERLLEDLWPDGTHVEFDLSLNASVKKLRRALGDNAQHPRFVETLPRVGYRFVFPVEHIDPAAKREIPSEAPQAEAAHPEKAADAPTPRVRWPRVLAAAAIAAASVALAGVFVGQDWWRAMTASSERAEEMKFSHRFYVGSRVSPDGSTLAYRDSETAHLWLADLDTGERRELIPDWVSSALAWSRDSRRIAFIKLGDPPRGLEIVDVESGERTRIPSDPKRRLTPWDWTADGRIVCTVRSEEDFSVRQAAFFSPEDGLITVLRTVPRSSSHFSLSPDERFIAYRDPVPATERNPAAQADIRLIAVHGDGEAVTLTDHPESEYYPFWSLDGRRVYFARRPTPVGNDNALWSVEIDPSTGEPSAPAEKVAGLGRWTLALTPSMGLTGEVFASRASKAGGPIHLIEVDPRSGSPIGEAISDFPELSADPHWTDDGKWLRYRAQSAPLSRDVKQTTYVERNIETGEERLRPQRKAPVSPPPYYYSESKEGGWAIHANRSENVIRRTFFDSGQTEVLLESDESIRQLLAFQDGREILFATHSEGRDLYQIKSLRLDGRNTRTVGTTRIPPQWEVSPNDREVAIGDLNCLLILPRYGGEIQELTCASPPRLPTPGKYPGVKVNYTWWTDLTPSWSPDGTKIAWTVTVEEKDRVELWIIDRLTGAYEMAWAGSEGFYTLPRQPAWSPAGRYIAFAIQGYSENEVWALKGIL